MKFIGIDIGSEKHLVAVVDRDGNVIRKPTEFHEDDGGYAKLRSLLGPSEDALVAMEATGHYWQNLFAFLASEGFKIALVNPMRTHHFAQGEEMRRAKTDALDALGIARFAQQKRPRVTPLRDDVTHELRELVRLRDRMMQDLGDRARQLHRALDLTFPEFTRHIADVKTPMATTLLSKYSTGTAFRDASPADIAKLAYGPRHKIGKELAEALCSAARKTVGRHHGVPYALQVRYACEDIATFRARLQKLDDDIGQSLQRHEVGKLLTTINGIGDNTAARLIASIDFGLFETAAQLASFIGVAPSVNHSGKRRPGRGPTSSMGNADLRAKLYMPTLCAVRVNPWLRVFYERLVAQGKPKKLALIAAMRKLLTAIFSVASSKTAFVPRLTA